MIWDWLRKSKNLDTPEDVEIFLGGVAFDRFDAASQVLGNFMDGDDEMRRLLSRTVYFVAKRLLKKMALRSSWM